MNAVVIGASSESIYAIQQAKKMGITTIALDGNPQAPGLQYAHESIVVDIRDPALIYNILDRYSPDVIIPIPIGRYLISIGAVNDHYGLCGVTEQAAHLCTDKHLFRSMISQHNHENKIEHFLVSAEDINVLYDYASMQYPIIAKPRFGSGSRAVKVFLTPFEFQRNFLSHLPFYEDFVVETCVEGVEYGADAAIINGEFRLILLREKVLTSLPYRQCVGYYSVVENKQNEELFKCIKKELCNASKALNLNNCLLHADIMWHDGNAFIIELSARPSGHYLYNVFTPLATGVDMISEYLKFSLPMLKQPYSFTPVQTKCMLIQYFDFSNCKVLRIPDERSLRENFPILDYKCNLEKDMILQQIVDGHSLMERGYYIVEGKDRADLDSIKNRIEKCFILEKI